jgi:hypothetical protein
MGSAVSYEYGSNAVADREYEAMVQRKNRESEARHAEERLAASEHPTDEQILGEARKVVADLSPRIAVLIEHQGAMLCLRDGIEARVCSVDFYEAEATASEALAEREDRDGHPEAAMLAADKARIARALFDSKAPRVRADQELLWGWDFQSKQDAIDAMSSRIAEAQGAIDDPTVRDEIVVERVRKIDEARAKRDAGFWAAYGATYRAQHPSAEDLATQAEFNRLMRTPDPVPVKVRRPSNAGAAALAAMAHGGRVGSPVQQAMSSRGGPVLQPLDPTGAR